MKTILSSFKNRSPISSFSSPIRIPNFKPKINFSKISIQNSFLPSSSLGLFSSFLGPNQKSRFLFNPLIKCRYSTSPNPSPNKNFKNFADNQAAKKVTHMKKPKKIFECSSCGEQQVLFDFTLWPK